MLLLALACLGPGQLTASPAVCQGVSFVGCCQGARLVWCDGNGLNSADCSVFAAPGNTCGWDVEMGTYDCGSQGADPKGVYARTCPVVDLDVSGDTGTESGCKVGVLVQNGCDGVTFQGCCDVAGGLLFCESGVRLCRLDCTSLMAPDNVCGWHAAGVSGYYDCGGVGPDPAGVHPMSCTVEIPQPDVMPGDSTAVGQCVDIPEGACCEGSVLRWCEFGVAREFDCGILARDPVFSQYVFCGGHSISGKTDCLTKPDPSPPRCGPVKEPDVIDATGPDQDIPGDLGDLIPTDHLVVDREEGDTPHGEDRAETSPIVIPIEPPSDPGPPTSSGRSCSTGPAGRAVPTGTAAMVVGMILAVACWIFRVRRLGGMGHE